MSELRAEVINLIEKMPEEKILPERKSAFGILSKYADKNLISEEKTAWEKSASEIYGKNFVKI